MAAAGGGDITALMEVLAPDVVLVTDGGGIKQAALRPIHGVDKVLRWLAGVLGKPESEGFTFELRSVNGELAIVANDAGGVDGVIFVTDRGRPDHRAARHPQPGEARRGLSGHRRKEFGAVRGRRRAPPKSWCLRQRTCCAAATTSTRP